MHVPRRVSQPETPVLLSVEVMLLTEVVLEEELALHHGPRNVVDAGIVFSRIPAESLEGDIGTDLSLGSEHAFGLLDNEPGVQRLPQLFGGALLLSCGRSV